MHSNNIALIVDKLQEIRKVTLASVFCKNIDNLTEIQRNALRQQTNRYS